MKTLKIEIASYEEMKARTMEWDPDEEYWCEPDEPIPEYARPIIARGPRPLFEMEQVLPGVDPDDLDDPIIESNDLLSVA